MDIDCACFTCAHLDKIGFLTKPKTYRSHVNASSSPFDRVPDEVLIHIFSYIPPVNIDNFVAFIALQMVSKRFHRCVAENGKILENTTELVIGIHPHLSDDQYLCHIGHFTLVPFLRRVKKITKLVMNVNDKWMCCEMRNSRYLPEIDHFFGEMELRELMLYEYLAHEVLANNLIKDSNRFLERVEINVKSGDFSRKPPLGICVELPKCSNLKNLSLIIKEWGQSDHDVCYQDFYEFVIKLKSIEVLEIDGYDPEMMNILDGAQAVDPPLKALQTLRLKHPKVLTSTLLHPKDRILFCYLRWIIESYSPTINEVEIDICPHSETLDYLPKILKCARAIHLKMTFLPYLELHKVKMIETLLENAQYTNVDGMKISLTFMYSDSDQKEKLSIVHRLLDRFDIPHEEAQQVEWEFFSGKVCVNLKMEMIADESLICHPYHPHEESDDQEEIIHVQNLLRLLL